MLLSMRWLSDYVDIGDMNIIEFCEKITMSGSKVEEYKFESSDIANVVVGKIISVSKHPDADKLLICMLDIGKENPLQIVTGAQNVFEGAVVPVALHNSTIENGVCITKGKIRGVESEGMMCSLKELGLAVNDFPYAVEDGIFIIEEECKIGQSIKDAININDIIVELEITPNRPDCLSVIGVAREVSTTLNKPLKNFNNNIEKYQKAINTNELQVEIKDPNLCGRYSAVIVKDVTIKPSPRWIRERLRNSGIRPINNFVDITNYVMLEYGQPIHAFDFNKIAEKKLIIRKAKTGEKVKILDESEKLLDDDMLVIADTQKILAIAGVMGGHDSGISEQTKSVVFEIAKFNAQSIRHTSKKLALRSESSIRFEKGIDVESINKIYARIFELINMLGIGKVVSLVDIDYETREKKEIILDLEFIKKRLGIDISLEEVKKIFLNLGFSFNYDETKIIIPSWRSDINCLYDLSEEVARIYGYDKIPSKFSKLLINPIASLSPEQKFKRNLVDIISIQGFFEIKTFSFISSKSYDKIGLNENNKLRNSIKISNPFGDDTSIMRSTLIPSILECLAKNYNNRNLTCKLFELAKEYMKKDDNELPYEKDSLALGMYGKDYDFYILKGIIENIVEYFNIKNVEFVSLEDNEIFHPGRCADILIDDIQIGTIGQIHPTTIEKYDLPTYTFAASLDVDKLFYYVKTDKKYTPLPKFPSVVRDLSLICNKELPVAIIEKTIKSEIGEKLESISLVDIYTGNQIKEHKKSVCYSLILRSDERTLTDNDIDIIINKVLKTLSNIDVYIRNI